MAAKEDFDDDEPPRKRIGWNYQGLNYSGEPKVNGDGNTSSPEEDVEVLEVLEVNPKKIPSTLNLLKSSSQREIKSMTRNVTQSNVGKYFSKTTHGTEIRKENVPLQSQTKPPFALGNKGVIPKVKKERPLYSSFVKINLKSDNHNVPGNNKLIKDHLRPNATTSIASSKNNEKPDTLSDNNNIANVTTGFKGSVTEVSKKDLLNPNVQQVSISNIPSGNAQSKPVNSISSLSNSKSSIICVDSSKKRLDVDKAKNKSSIHEADLEIISNEYPRQLNSSSSIAEKTPTADSIASATVLSNHILPSTTNAHLIPVNSSENSFDDLEILTSPLKNVQKANPKQKIVVSSSNINSLSSTKEASKKQDQNDLEIISSVIDNSHPSTSNHSNTTDKQPVSTSVNNSVDDDIECISTNNLPRKKFKANYKNQDELQILTPVIPSSSCKPDNLTKTNQNSATLNKSCNDEIQCLSNFDAVKTKTSYIRQNKNKNQDDLEIIATTGLKLNHPIRSPMVASQHNLNNSNILKPAMSPRRYTRQRPYSRHRFTTPRRLATRGRMHTTSVNNMQNFPSPSFQNTKNVSPSEKQLNSPDKDQSSLFNVDNVPSLLQTVQSCGEQNTSTSGTSKSYKSPTTFPEKVLEVSVITAVSSNVNPQISVTPTSKQPLVQSSENKVKSLQLPPIVKQTPNLSQRNNQILASSTSKILASNGPSSSQAGQSAVKSIKQEHRQSNLPSQNSKDDVFPEKSLTASTPLVSNHSDETSASISPPNHLPLESIDTGQQSHLCNEDKSSHSDIKQKSDLVSSPLPPSKKPTSPDINDTLTYKIGKESSIIPNEDLPIPQGKNSLNKKSCNSDINEPIALQESMDDESISKDLTKPECESQMDINSKEKSSNEDEAITQPPNLESKNSDDQISQDVQNASSSKVSSREKPSDESSEIKMEDITSELSRETVESFMVRWKELKKLSSEDNIIKEKIWKSYYLSHSTYTHSRKFVHMVRKAVSKLDSENLYVIIKEIVDQLKQFKDVPYIEKKKKGQEKQTVASEEEEEEMDENTRKNKRKLAMIEKRMMAIDKKIKKLEEAEVDWDDEVNSSYCLSSRLKNEFMRLDDYYCKLSNCVKSTGRPVHKKFKYEGSRYPEINKRITIWVNKNRCFPDYQDVLHLVRKVSKDKLLPMKPECIRVQAQEIFSEVGQMLKSRRQKDDEFSIFAYAGSEVISEPDPAKKDQELDEKLKKNEPLARSRLEQVFQNFVEKELLQPSKYMKTPEKGKKKASPSNSKTSLCTDSDESDSDDARPTKKTKTDMPSGSNDPQCSKQSTESSGKLNSKSQALLDNEINKEINEFIKGQPEEDEDEEQEDSDDSEEENLNLEDSDSCEGSILIKKEADEELDVKPFTTFRSKSKLSLSCLSKKPPKEQPEIVMID